MREEMKDERNGQIKDDQISFQLKTFIYKIELFYKRISQSNQSPKYHLCITIIEQFD